MEAFAVPILPDKAEAWKAWTGEVTGIARRTSRR